MKIKAKIKQDKVEVKLLAKHPMETGIRKDKETGEVIPPKFIQELTCKHKDRLVFIANLSRAVSKDPYLSFYFSGAAKGDQIVFNWVDNTGESLTTEATIK